MTNNTGVISIHGKEYLTVGRRISDFRSSHPGHTVTCKIVSNADDMVVVKAFIKDEAGRTISTGYAEENRNIGNINKTSALENAETSAVGRALAFFGLGGTEIASADEVANAVAQRPAVEASERLVAMGNAAREHFDDVQCIKTGLLQSPDTESGFFDLESAAQAYFELSDDIKRALWVAPTKGGIFTTKEREIIKSTAFREAYYGASK